MKKNFLCIIFCAVFLFLDIQNSFSRTFYEKKNCLQCKRAERQQFFQKKFRKNEKKDEICKWEKPILNLFNSKENNDDQPIKEVDYTKIDPWEKRNKKILRFNLFLFRNTILPFVFLIDAWIPRPVQDLFLNFTYNFLEPKNYIVHKLSGENEKARICGERFVINTFLGGGGLMNTAEKKFGDKYQRIDKKFDYAFYKKNIEAGRYIILPVVNDYYEREFASDLIEWLVNPIFYFTLPFNYAYYILYRSILLTDKKETLFYNRKYDDAVYNNLRDLKKYEISNYQN